MLALILIMADESKVRVRLCAAEIARLGCLPLIRIDMCCVPATQGGNAPGIRGATYAKNGRTPR